MRSTIQGWTVVLSIPSLHVEHIKYTFLVLTANLDCDSYTQVPRRKAAGEETHTNTHTQPPIVHSKYLKRRQCDQSGLPLIRSFCYEIFSYVTTSGQYKVKNAKTFGIKRAVRGQQPTDSKWALSFGPITDSNTCPCQPSQSRMKPPMLDFLVFSSRALVMHSRHANSRVSWINGRCGPMLASPALPIRPTLA